MFSNEPNEPYNWTVESEPLNEFNTPYLASMSFPTLFTDGKGDPTNVATCRKIANNDTETFAEKIKHLIKFGEYCNGPWGLSVCFPPKVCILGIKYFI